MKINFASLFQIGKLSTLLNWNFQFHAVIIIFLSKTMEGTDQTSILFFWLKGNGTLLQTVFHERLNDLYNCCSNSQANGVCDIWESGYWGQ